MPQPFILLRFHFARAQPIMSEASNVRTVPRCRVGFI
jgi:hypothetical protein